VHANPKAEVSLEKEGFFFAVGVRNYLSNEYKDPMSTTRTATVEEPGKPYSYKGFTDPTGPNPWVKWQA